MKNKMIILGVIENIESSIKLSQNQKSSPSVSIHKTFLAVGTYQLTGECQKIPTHPKASVNFPSSNDISNKTFNLSKQKLLLTRLDIQII